MKVLLLLRFAFIVRQHSAAQYWYDFLNVCPSVCPSVHHSLVLCLNDCTYHYLSLITYHFSPPGRDSRSATVYSFRHGAERSRASRRGHSRLTQRTSTVYTIR